MNRKVVRFTPIDEVELVLGLCKIEHPEFLKDKTNKEISEVLNAFYDISCTEQDIFLLYEPNIEELELDLRVHFNSMDLVMY